jgi:Abnormal spindle-like microcephaly-assoc'd, ASPM-SPD-2-Hydin
MSKSYIYLSAVLIMHSVLCVTNVFSQGVAAVSAVPHTLQFGDVPVGSSSTQTVSVNNTGMTPVTILGTRVTGAGFGLNGPSLPLTLAAWSKHELYGYLRPNRRG